MRTERLLQADRYLPCRKARSHDSTLTLDQHSTASTATSSAYLQLIAHSPQRCLSFAKLASSEPSVLSFSTLSKCSSIIKEGTARFHKQQKRQIKKIAAEEILDAPGVVNDFYFNVLDGTSKDMLALGLMENCYIYRPKEKVTFELSLGLRSMSNNLLTCLKFNSQETMLYVGNEEGYVHVMDLEKLISARSFKAHHSRIGCIENTEQWGFLSGSKDKTIVHNDIRLKDPTILHVFTHKTEVCGISMKNYNVASGSNDGRVHIWDLRNDNVYFSDHFHHSAAKTLQWCPWKVDLLASGGGSSDHRIVFWNNQELKIEKTINAINQVTCLKWRESTRDLITGHGSTNGYNGCGLIWNVQKGQCKTILAGHQGRILGLTVTSRRGIWTLGKDETLRFWQSPEEEGGEQKKQNCGKQSLMSLTLK